MQNKTIKVVPYKVGELANGQQVSRFSAGVVRIVDTGLFTWQLVDTDGRTTQGLGIKPATSFEEAVTIATRFAEQAGYTYLTVQPYRKLIMETIDIPADFPVKPLTDTSTATDPVTCGHCGLSWDDSLPTSYTPAPSGRCPFEIFHSQSTKGN